jgi:hypothetical protein
MSLTLEDIQALMPDDQAVIDAADAFFNLNVPAWDADVRSKAGNSLWNTSMTVNGLDEAEAPYVLSHLVDYFEGCEVALDLIAGTTWTLAIDWVG